MQTEIKITYQHYLPESLITDFEQSGIDRQLSSQIEKKKTDQTRYSNFTGPEISDIIIFIQQHQTELIVGGLFVNATYDVLKASIVALWTGLSKLTKKQLKDAGKEVNEPKQITLRLSDNDKEVEVLFQGDVNSELANKIIDESFKFISSSKVKEAFDNPDNISEVKVKPKIRLLYNKNTKTWEPENFGEYRKKMEEYDNWIKKNLTS